MQAMTSTNWMRALMCAVGCLVAAANALAQSTTIISDNFTGTTNTSLSIHAPDTNLMGGAWTVSPAGAAVLRTNEVGVATGAANGFVDATIDAGTANVTLDVNWRVAPNLDYFAGIVLRQADAQTMSCCKWATGRSTSTA